MLKKGLLHEFKYETENTRKLLKAITESSMTWKPHLKNWTTAQLASHIAGIYNMYDSVINKDELALENYKYNQGDISKPQNIIAKFEENVAKAQKALEGFDESKAINPWKMTMNGKELIPPMPRIAVIRSILFNHLYHHRGELVSYLRCTGNKVPGLYGPTVDDIK